MKTIKIISCVAFAIFASGVFAGSAAAKLEAMGKSRISGVTGIKKNADGSIRSLLIIGRANLNKLMDEDEAEENAREDAAINASTAFAEYLNKSVSVSRRRINATKTVSSATDANGQVNKSGSAETISVKSQEFASMSKAAIAGMKEIYAGVHNSKYVIIYAWDKAECKQLEGVIMTMSETAQKAVKEAKDLESRMTAPAGTPQPPVRVNNGKGSKRRGAPAIQEGGSASDDAGDYL